MKRLLFLLFHCIIASISVYTQPTIQWQKSLGGSGRDIAQSVQVANGGSYVVAGWSNSNDGDVTGNYGDYDFWVVKLDLNGDIEWQKTMGGSSSDAATTIHATPDGGYIVGGGTFSNDGQVSGHHGSTDCWVVKLNQAGTMQWQKTLGGSDAEEVTAIQPTSDDGYILAGGSTSNDGDVTGNHGDNDCWIVKLDSLGAIQWQKSLGGSGNDGAYAIRQTSDNGFIVAGYTESNDGDVSGNHGDYDMWVVKLSQNGAIQWQKTLGGSSTESAHAIQPTGDGGYIVTGFSDSNDGDVSGNNGDADFWVVKLDVAGSIQWQKSLGGSVFEHAHSIQVTGDSGYIATGFSASNDGDVFGNHGSGDFWVVKLNHEGAIQWQKTLGGSALDVAYSIQPTGDGGYIAAGSSDSNDGDVSGNHGDYDMWVVKLNPITKTGDYPNTVEWQVFPNPATDFIEIQTDENDPAIKIAIMDVLGKRLMERYIGNNSPLDVSLLPQGLYLVEILTQSGKTANKKIVKQ